MHHICLSKGFPYTYEASGNTYDATTNILSADILPVKELKGLLRHIESQLPSIMHLTISSDNTLHFYRYLENPCTSSRKTISPTHRCSYSGQSTAVPDI